MLSLVDYRTYAVSSIYRQRYCEARSTAPRGTLTNCPPLHRKRGHGVETVGTAGFGCLLLRRSQVADIPMRGNEQPSRYYDVALNAHMNAERPELVLKVDGGLVCDHIGATIPAE